MCGITGFIVNNSSKNLEVETTVSDMISKIISYKISNEP